MENTVLPPTAPPKHPVLRHPVLSVCRGASLGSGTYTGRSVWLGKPSAPGIPKIGSSIHPNELVVELVVHWNHPQLGDDLVG